MKTDCRNDKLTDIELTAEEIFAEVYLFGEINTGSGINADCGCVACDGNPCVKIDN